MIAPALAQGIWVLCDRFADSTRVYQGKVGQVDARLLSSLARVTIGCLRPDLTVILDLPVEDGMKRAAARRGADAPDRFEAEDISFHQKLREGYREIAASEPERCILIDASGTQEQVAEKVWAAVQGRLIETSHAAQVNPA